MDPTAFLIRSLLFPAWVRKNGSRRLVYARELAKTERLSSDALRELQWVQLKAILQHAFDQCAFYRKKWTEAGVSPGDVESLDDINRIPTLTKAEIQESLSELVADNYRPRPLIRDMTGGSTGSPMVFYYDEDRRDSREAAVIRHDRWTGWDIGEKRALLWGAPRDVAGGSRAGRFRNRVLGRDMALDASALDEPRMRRFCERLQRYQPAFVVAYANTLTLFARFVKDAGLEPMRPRAIICSGEVLTGEGRALIESTFGCAVFDRYGCREFAVIASECDRHQGLHVNAENLLLEVLQDPAAAPDSGGEIVITDLKNYAMPLIRYRSRDVGYLKPSRCDCGRGLPILELRGGRTTDFLTALNGQKVSGIVLATYGITNIDGLRQVQFIQERRDAVRARIVRGPGWSQEALDTLIAKVRAFLGDAMAVEVEFTDAIGLESSGKYRFTISRL